MEPTVVQSNNLDANESIFFARELEHIKTKEYNVKFPEFKARRFIPVDTQAAPGDKSITYDQFTEIGVSEFISDYADDLPNVSATGKQFTTPIREHGNSFTFSNKEIRSGAAAGRPLKPKLQSASRRAYEQLVDNTAWLGDGTYAFRGLTGIVYNPNITVSPAPNGTWASATPDAIIADINFAINNVKTVTKGVESANTLLMNVADLALISTTPRSATSDTTILEFVKKNHRGVIFDEVAKLTALDPKPSGGAGPVDILLAFRSNPDNITLDIPMEYTMNNPQERNLAQVVPTEGSLAGVIIYYPLSVHVVEGL